MTEFYKGLQKFIRMLFFSENMTKGQIISGRFGEVLIRQKNGEKIEIGEILVAENVDAKMLLQVYDLVYGSQISQQNLELISGMALEEQTDMEFVNSNLRNYVLAKVKNLITIRNTDVNTSKHLPEFFSNVRSIEKNDISFITTPANPLSFGNLRSGSDVVDVNICLDGVKVLQHHILIAATTGRGKSNLVKTMLWDIVGKEYCGILVLDPHDEYFGRTEFGLKDHTEKDKVIYYSKNPTLGGRSLKVNLKNIRPTHFSGIVAWSDPQLEALYAFYKKYREEWIESIILEKEIENFQEGTLNVVRRKLMSLLDIHKGQGENLFCSGIFDLQSGQSTVRDIVTDLENARIVVIDTSSIAGNAELLVGSMVTTEIFRRYRKNKTDGTLENKPVISIVLEEAPRVLGKAVLEKGHNIFETIAREGRKFKVGLTAITQLPSLIPREILANMNTKVILGIEMGPERQAIIESSAQDLSADNRAIASLDKGEAIITSNFARFAMPIKIPLFGENLPKDQKTIHSYQKEYLGVELL